MSDETPAQQLLREWHEALEACDRFEHGELDETGRARLEELRFHEARLAERVRAEGLIPEHLEPRSGLWAPLPLHEPDPCPPESELPLDSFSEPTGAAPKIVPYDRVVRGINWMYQGRARGRRLRRYLAHDFAGRRFTTPGARLLAAVYEDLGEDHAARVVRDLHGLPQPPQSPDGPPQEPREVQPPFLPSEVDGLTPAQRRIVEVLASYSPAYQRVPVIVEDALGTFDGPTLERAIEELLRPRPYPLLERDPAHLQELRLRLTELAMEMVEQKPGCAPRVHGAFFPNLLVNGCAEPLAFPTHHLGEIIQEAKASAAFLNERGLFSKFQGPDFSEGLQCNFPRFLYWQGSGQLDFMLRVRWDGMTAFVLDLFPPGVTADEVQAVIEEARTSGALDGVTSVSCTGDSVRVEVEHAAFGRAVLRLLDRRGLFHRAWTLSLTHESSGSQPHTSWLGQLVRLFYERTRTVVASRLREEEDVLTARLRDLDELERAHASRAQVDRVLDVALDGTEAVWALTHLGTPEFARHRAFGSVDVGGLAPFSEAAAKSIVKGGASRLGSAALERRDLLDRLETLRELRAPDRLRAQVFEALDRIASKYARRERRTVVTSLASCALELSLE